MHERPQPLPLIEYLQTETHRWLLPEEAEVRLPKLIDQGLQVMVLCYEGRGVSRVVAEMLAVHKKIPAMYLRFGLAAFARLEPGATSRLIHQLAKVPVVVSYVPFETLREASNRERAVFEELEQALTVESGHHFLKTGPLRQTPSLADILKSLNADTKHKLD